jgi:hypothetical protein
LTGKKNPGQKYDSGDAHDSVLKKITDMFNASGPHDYLKFSNFAQQVIRDEIPPSDNKAILDLQNAVDQMKQDKNKFPHSLEPKPV